MKPFALAFLGGLLALGSACATQMYAGPQRGDDETAVLLPGKSTTILSVDRRKPPDLGASRYEILIGKRKIVAAAVSENGRIAPAAAPVSVCFSAMPEHVYEIRVWPVRTEIGDVLTKSVLVDVESGDDTKESCSDELPTARAVSAANKGSATGAITSMDRGAGPRTQSGSLREPPLGTGLQLGFGLATGGDTLVTATYTNGKTENLTAGSGAAATLGGTVTPVWIAGTVGLGMGGTMGLKYSSVGASSGQVTFTRYAVDLWLQSLIRLSETWYVKVASGAHKDLGASVYGTGSAAGLRADLQSPLGWMAEIGPYWLASWHWAISVSARLTSLRYTTLLGSADGTNLSLETAFHFNL